MRRAGTALRALALAAALAVSSGAAVGDTAVRMPQTPAGRVALAELQAAAVSAVQAGDDLRAAELARRILSAAPGDALAEFVLTVVEMRAGRLKEARLHGRRAYRLAGTQQQRFQTAMIAADIAGREKRPVAARYWLRQAADQAPNERWRAGVLGVLAEEKAKAPVALRLSFSLAPSSNVNNGSSSPYSVIDGLPIVGVISEEGRALSGWEGSVKLGLDWKLHETALTRTELLTEATLYRVALSENAQAAAPGLSAKSLGDTVVMAGLRHSVVAADGKARTVMTALAGRGESGAGAGRDLVTLGLRQLRDLGGGEVLSWGLDAQWTGQEIATRSDTLRKSLTLGYGRPVGGAGNRLYGEILVAETDAGAGSDRDLRENRTAMARVVWSRAEPIGPFSLSLSAGISLADYPDYRLGFIVVPGGRQDVTGFAEVALGLDRMSWAGFRPVVSLRGMRTDSNVSIFSTRDTSLGLGLAAEF